MKTVKKLQKDIDEILSEMKDLNKSDNSADRRAFKRLKKRVQYLKIVLMYLETNPTKEFCEKEKLRLENRIELLMKTFSPLKNGTLSQQNKHLKWFEKEMGITKIKPQIKH